MNMHSVKWMVCVYFVSVLHDTLSAVSNVEILWKPVEKEGS
jgi:hypothetical protein